jgi:serine/threonine-protein kinase
MQEDSEIPRTPSRNYEFIEILADSDEDRVMLARDDDNHRWIIKEIYPTDAMPAEIESFHRRFVRIAGQLAALKHPSLPRVIEFFVYENNGFLVKEYLEGRTLRDIVEQAEVPLPEDTLKYWLSQLCEAVSVLHGQKPPILLEGLLPGSILVAPTGRVRIVDMGISRFLNGEARRKALMKLPKAFISPEQARGEEPSESSDIYSIGAVAYYCFTKMPPGQLDPKALSLGEVRMDVSPEVNRSITRALQPSVSQRFLTVDELRKTLERKEIPASVPPLVVDVPYIEFNNARRGEILSTKFRITRQDQAEVRGKVSADEQWVRIPFDVFAGKFNIVTIHIDTSTLSDAETNYARLKIVSEHETREIPISVNLQKTVGRKLMGFIFKEKK